MDLAQAIAPECETTIVGIRPGEKIHELMIPQEEARKTLEFDNFYVIQPEFKFWSRRCSWDGENPVAVDFEYNSGSNPWRLTVEEMRGMIEYL